MPASPDAAHGVSEPDPLDHDRAMASARAATAVRRVWERSRTTVLARIDAMEELVAALLEGRLDPDTRRAGESEAHKLAGAAGTFGFARASELARVFELAVGPEATLDADQAPALAEITESLRRELSGSPSTVRPEPPAATDP